MRVEIAFGSAAGGVVAGGVVAGGVVVPVSAPVVAPLSDVDPLALPDDVPAAVVVAGADFFADVPFVVLSDFAPPNPFDPVSVRVPDVVLPDVFGDPLDLGDADVAELFGPPFAVCTRAFGPFGPWAAAGATIVADANDSANAITSGCERLMNPSARFYVKGRTGGGGVVTSAV
jgi:hypothetical protein